MSDGDAGPRRNDELTQIVDAWHRPIFNLAYRMLGNEADAADATQEIFLAVVLNLNRWDRRRPFKPWIYRVAFNALFNFRRSSRRRMQHENRAPMKEDPVDVNDRAERVEMESAIHAQLAKLPESSRALVVLHFFQGLSQTEVAESLSLPRTTVQSRIEKALDSMKRGLAASGFVTAVPALESVLRSSPSRAVPEFLLSTLMRSAVNARSLAAAAAAPSAIGGLLVTKHLVGAVVLFVAFFVGAGLLIVPGRANENRAAGVGESAAPLAATVRTLDEPAIAAAHDRPEAPPERPSDPAPSVSSTSRASIAVASAAPKSSTSALDWATFADVFAANYEAMFAAMRPPSAGKGRDMTPEDGARVMKLMAEFANITARAWEQSPMPFFDPEILSALAKSVFATPLGLSADQTRSLDETTRSLLAKARSGFDPTDALPIEIYLARRRTLRDLLDSVENMLDDSQKQKWVPVMMTGGTMMEQNLVAANIGIGAGEKSYVPADEIVRQWTEEFSLDSGQTEFVRGLVPGYLSEAESILSRFGQFGDAPLNLSLADDTRLRDELASLQIQTEQRFRHFFTPEQMKSLRLKPPRVICFNAGHDFSIGASNAPNHF
ncbi:MAG: sigma-70 family RNA polymerase sigma factor [Planctomycetes bacterium]|nr:sigma-70 family RNA polymerase sigma factor [Planctomycetota bacterium]